MELKRDLSALNADVKLTPQHGPHHAAASLAAPEDHLFAAEMKWEVLK
jgi:hypothetical protein